MVESPERIWAGNRLGEAYWTNIETAASFVEYVRADRIEALERELAENRRRNAELDREITGLRNSYWEERKAHLAAEAREARLSEALRSIAEGNLGEASWQANYDRIRGVARTALSGSGSGGWQDGLSKWDGWDNARDPWGETKHKDAVLEALFRGPWSMEDAAALIGFIDRTWTKRFAAPQPTGGE